MRERMLFLSAKNHQTEDLEGDIRTGRFLEILQEKYEIDHLTYWNSSKELSVTSGPAFTMYKERRAEAVASQRTKLRSLYKLRDYTYRSNPGKDMRDTLTGLCRSNKYSHVFISHSLIQNCMDIIRHLIPKAIIITDAYRSMDGRGVGETMGKRRISRPYHKLNAVLVRREERNLLNKTGLLLATSEWDALSFKSLSFADACKVHVVPHFIDIHQYQYRDREPVFKENSIVLYWNMNTRPGKQVALLFFREIYSRIKMKVPDVRCYIVGREVPTEVAEQAEEDESIIITGPVEGAAEYIRRSKAVFAPLLDNYEARNKVLESWALRTPVVSSTKGSEGLNCKHNHNILLANTAMDAVDNIVTLLKDSGLGTIIADRAHQTLLKHYEANSVRAKILSLV
ncbi:glycosyltransferase family 4 protein [Paenibacillus monticola]|uniref:Glycosyltransferase n=1 Tax=Paenibacillus monticola TaxID=2666075 RepID=A0A7X2L4D3_9BACL|nr:glycosyltransferase family 4 protein [Paenibacillus monticola]MRN56230.1 glycosyltransferase [Paenibacillus monticola]